MGYYYQRPILYMNKPRHREAKQLTQGLLASKQRHWDSNPSNLAPELNPPPSTYSHVPLLSLRGWPLLSLRHSSLQKGLWRGRTTPQPTQTWGLPPTPAPPPLSCWSPHQDSGSISRDREGDNFPASPVYYIPQQFHEISTPLSSQSLHQVPE